MEILLLLLLLVVAGAVFLPDMLKERVLDSPVDTISDFRRGMIALAISTRNDRPKQGAYYAVAGGEPEPYVRRSSYSRDRENDYLEEEFIPYPTNKARAEMVNRRNRIIALLLVVTVATATLAVIPSLRWIIPVHLVLLLILAIYIGLSILLPHYDNRR